MSSINKDNIHHKVTMLSSRLVKMNTTMLSLDVQLQQIGWETVFENYHKNVCIIKNGSADKIATSWFISSNGNI